MSSVNPEKKLCFCCVLANVAGTRQTRPGIAFSTVLSVALIHTGSLACSGLLGFLGVSVVTVNVCMDV